MNDFQLNSLIDLSAVQKMADANYKASGMPIGIVDAIDGGILVGTGWQDICLKFHRADKKSLKLCQESDDHIKDNLTQGEACRYKCKNGLWDIGIPIFAADKHLATLFLGQFFYEGETPEREFFIQQAKRFDYDLKEYLKALERVPVFSREKVNYIIEYNKSLANFITDLATNAVSIKKAEAELIKSEAKYRRLTENAKALICRMSLPEGHYEYVNPASIDLLGYTPEEVYKSPLLIQKIIHPDWQNYFKEQWGRLIHGDAPPTYEYQIVHRSGETRWLSQRNVLVRDGEGRPVALEGIATDITDRKLLEESLKYNESFLSILLDTIPIPVFYKDTEGKYLGFNKAFQNFFGQKKEHLIGKTVFDINQEDLTDIFHRKDAELFINGGVQQYESKMKNALGEIRDVIFFKGVFTDTQGSIKGIIGTILDITEKTKIEKQLRQAQKREAIGTLSGGIAHDFNNILSGIFGYCQLADKHINKPESAKKYIGKILEGAQRATSLIQQILTFSREDQRSKQPLDIFFVLKEALALIRSTIPASIEIKETYNTRAMIFADSTQIHQVIINLCTNAYHAMSEDGILTVKSEEIEFLENQTHRGGDFPPGKYLRLEIGDNGSGMDDQIKEKIFDPYFTTKQPGKGTGLGLAVVDAIVKKHNGFIEIDTEPGAGTVFQIYLPVLEEDVNIRTKTVPEKKEEKISGASGNVMVVDDEPAILETLKAILSNQGYQVSVFDNGESALKGFSENPDKFDIIITDMAMPRMTGEKLSKEVLKLRADIPIIICTGYHKNFTEDDAVKIGIKKYVRKPVPGTELSKFIRNLLIE